MRGLMSEPGSAGYSGNISTRVRPATELLLRHGTLYVSSFGFKICQSEVRYLTSRLYVQLLAVKREKEYPTRAASGGANVQEENQPSPSDKVFRYQSVHPCRVCPALVLSDLSAWPPTRPIRIVIRRHHRTRAAITLKLWTRQAYDRSAASGQPFEDRGKIL